MEREPVFKVDERRGDEDDRRWAEEGPEGRREWGGQMVKFVCGTITLVHDVFT